MSKTEQNIVMENYWYILDSLTPHQAMLVESHSEDPVEKLKYIVRELAVGMKVKRIARETLMILDNSGIN